MFITCLHEFLDVNITSGGGGISIRHLQAQKMAHVSSNGGHVQIDGLDGNAAIFTNGGNLQLQLLTNAKEVKIKVGAGEILLFLPSEDHFKFQVERIKEDETCAEDLFHLRTQGSFTERSKEDPSSCRVRISGSGKVTTIRRSWLESVMQAHTPLKAVGSCVEKGLP
ncbi:hypothetical protein L7F22_060786 [Adiantum nelumboides]|nr:hypothetical protein [Adiantum nelumboides]